MKTLITVTNPKLKKLIFRTEALEKLAQWSEVHWLDHRGELHGLPLADVLHDFDACLTSWGSPRLTAELVEKAPKLKFIGHAAGTVVPYVDPSLFMKGITIVNANSALSRATAEGTVAMMAAGSYQLLSYNRTFTEGGWADNDTEYVPGLYRQTIGLIGYGDIAREVIRLLQPYEPQILLYSNHCSEAEAASLGLHLCSHLDELLERSHIISLHNTLTSTSRGMIGQRELDLIQNGALLINTARGPIIDEHALAATLGTGRIRAMLDVFDTEPLNLTSPLRRLPNVWCFPHIAAYSGYWKSRLGQTVIEDMERWIRGGKLTGEITVDKYNRMTLM
ncbi:hydroxyacid dehydrogenase [Paenibacillus sp. GCM10023252]|uniref:hydroxyacid dehydrogenase n=1 Tax=Paenibacillus sp. GCM10023252 TaxID=3252649 RepID=UPI0036233470